jgi:hypothetical protein
VAGVAVNVQVNFTKNGCWDVELSCRVKVFLGFYVMVKLLAIVKITVPVGSAVFEKEGLR